MDNTSKAAAGKGVGEDPKVDIRVEPGERVVLAPGSRFRESYVHFQPRSIDDVRKAIGLSAEAAASLVKLGRTSLPYRPGATVSPDELQADHAPTKQRAMALSYRAAHAYVHAPDPRLLAEWKPTLDSFLALTNAVLNLVSVNDIDVADNATLVISQDTHAVYARNVRIHGHGRIVCNGPVTFRLATLEGERPRARSAVFGEVIARA